MQRHRKPSIKLEQNTLKEIEKYCTQNNTEAFSVDEFLNTQAHSPKVTIRYAANYYKLKLQLPHAAEEFIRSLAVSDTYSQISLMGNFVESEFKKLQVIEQNKNHLENFDKLIKERNNSKLIISNG